MRAAPSSHRRQRGPDRAARRDVRPAWFNAPRISRPGRRLAAAVSERNAYCAPTMETLTSDDSELLDELTSVASLPDVTGPMLQRTRRQLSSAVAVRVGLLQAGYTAAVVSPNVCHHRSVAVHAATQERGRPDPPPGGGNSRGSFCSLRRSMSPPACAAEGSSPAFAIIFCKLSSSVAASGRVRS